MDLIGLILIGEVERTLDSVNNYLEIHIAVSYHDTTTPLTSEVDLVQEFTSLDETLEVTSNVTI